MDTSRRSLILGAATVPALAAATRNADQAATIRQLRDTVKSDRQAVAQYRWNRQDQYLERLVIAMIAAGHIDDAVECAKALGVNGDGAPINTHAKRVMVAGHIHQRREAFNALPRTGHGIPIFPDASQAA